MENDTTKLTAADKQTKNREVAAASEPRQIFMFRFPECVVNFLNSDAWKKDRN